MLYPHPADQALPLAERRFLCREHLTFTGHGDQAAMEHLRDSHPKLYVMLASQPPQGVRPPNRQERRHGKRQPGILRT